MPKALLFAFNWAPDYRSRKGLEFASKKEYFGQGWLNLALDRQTDTQSAAIIIYTGRKQLP